MTEPMHILVYGDSLSWGIVPGTRQRLPYAQRWPGILARELEDCGLHIHLTEDCLNGRRTVFEDPFRPGRRGVTGLGQVIEAQSPLALVIVMLGTNDFQAPSQNTAWHAAQGVATVVQAIRQAPVEPGMLIPRILVVAPPHLGELRGMNVEKFAGGVLSSQELAAQLAQVCQELGCAFFDANTVAHTSAVDGVHLDAEQHESLGRALATPVRDLVEAE